MIIEAFVFGVVHGLIFFFYGGLFFSTLLHVLWNLKEAIIDIGKNKKKLYEKIKDDLPDQLIKDIEKYVSTL